MVDPSFAYCYIPRRKVAQTALNTSSTRCCFWFTMTKRSTHFENIVLVQNEAHTFLWFLWGVRCLLQIYCTIYQNDFFYVFWSNHFFWATEVLDIIGVLGSQLKVREPLLYHLYLWRKVWITLIKSSFGLDGVFYVTIKINQNTKLVWIHCFQM